MVDGSGIAAVGSRCCHGVFVVTMTMIKAAIPSVMRNGLHYLLVALAIVAMVAVVFVVFVRETE